MIRLYDFPLSGNCHKVRLFLSLLGLPYETVFVDLIAKAQHEPWFSRINSLEQVPVLTDGDFTVQDSQAILVYLARRYDRRWFSDDPREMGQVMEWLSFAAKEIGTTLQPARLYYRAGEETDIESAQRLGRRVLHILDRRLADRDWLCLGRPTIADLACFPYVGLCREGKLPLDDYTNVLAWIDRIVALDGYVSMEGLPEPSRRQRAIA